MKNPNAYWEDVNNKANIFDGEYVQYKDKDQAKSRAELKDDMSNYDSKLDAIWRKPEEDKVNHPSHYCQGGIEVIDIIESAVTGLEPFEAVCAGNAIKYLCRWKHKNGVEDLQKAIWYINKLIEYNSGE